MEAGPYRTIRSATLIPTLIASIAALATVGSITTLMALSAEADAARLYRWTDAEGVVHVSDKPPERTDTATDVTEEDVAPIPVTGSRRVPLERIRAARGVTEASGAADDAAEERAQRRRRCADWRARVEAIEDRLRDGYGPAEGQALDEERRELQRAILREC